MPVKISSTTEPVTYASERDSSRHRIVIAAMNLIFCVVAAGIIASLAYALRYQHSTQKHDEQWLTFIHHLWNTPGQMGWTSKR
jgi:hypothetical protein